MYRLHLFFTCAGYGCWEHSNRKYSFSFNDDFVWSWSCFRLWDYIVLHLSTRINLLSENFNQFEWFLITLVIDESLIFSETLKEEASSRLPSGIIILGTIYAPRMEPWPELSPAQFACCPKQGLARHPRHHLAFQRRIARPKAVRLRRKMPSAGKTRFLGASSQRSPVKMFLGFSVRLSDSIALLPDKFCIRYLRVVK